MRAIHIITPVKDSIQTTIQTIESVKQSIVDFPIDYTIFNDNSTAENTALLKKICNDYQINLVNIAELTNHPSPNYLTILQMAQLKAIAEEAHLIIVESDVVIKPDTIQQLANMAERLQNGALLGAVTVDHDGNINYPYLYAQRMRPTMLPTRKRISFCCTLITNPFLQAYSFKELNPEKNWYDVHISHKALAMGFSNYIFTQLPVLHQPHSSRPWKNLKYTNPIKYYWLKATKGLDKI